MPKGIGLSPKLNIDRILGYMVATMKVDMNDVEYVTETTITIRGTRRRTTVLKVIVNKDKLR